MVGQQVQDQIEGIALLTAQVEQRRLAVNGQLDPRTRAELGQFMTPASVAANLASCVRLDRDEFCILDPGAGIGSLTAALVARILLADAMPKRVRMTAFEVDPVMLVGLKSTLDDCSQALEHAGISAEIDINSEDFITWALNQSQPPEFNVAILNPPFKKLDARGSIAQQLKTRNWSAANLYTAFWSAAIDRVVPGGDVIAITPRSFCNGTYFRSFRQLLLTRTALKSIRIHESRTKAFSDDGVLQETIITHSVRGEHQGLVALTVADESVNTSVTRVAQPTEVVHANDVNQFIRLPIGDESDAVHSDMGRFNTTLGQLGMSISTGPVVDFRSREYLLMDATQSSIPLLYPMHFSEQNIAWPKLGARKPNALSPTVPTKLLVPDGSYTLVKRVSAKEEPRRVVAAFYDGSLGRPASSDRHAGLDLKVAEQNLIGFENHLNYFHVNRGPLPARIAKALVLYLNSTLVDNYLRQFNGHTQVNAGDLRSLPYPSMSQLERLARAWASDIDQGQIDAALSEL